MSGVHLIPVERLAAAMRLVVAGFGSSAAEIEAVAGNLIEANLTGHDSHGIGMLPRYADAWLEGGLVPNTAARVPRAAASSRWAMRTTSAASAPGPSNVLPRGWCRCTSST